MQRTLLKSKIHRATVTGADMHYEGSISIDRNLCLEADMKEFEKVDIYNINNGERFSTYVIFGGEGEISLNGAAARLVQVGDIIIIASYAQYEENGIKNHSPKVILVDGANRTKSKEFATESTVSV
ncbi:MAG: aspartate 1-decarboxylase [Bacteroidetes bacterium]|nr:aspartate 1-decarboxylase [Bacteroidota bacterium]MCL6097579.1 aspartate 1-decarboxylase [Bacteroidota bacterium]